MLSCALHLKRFWDDDEPSHRWTIRWNAISVVWSCSVVSGHSFCTRRGGGIQEHLQESEPEEEEPEAKMMMMGDPLRWCLVFGLNVSPTGEERPRSIKSGLQNNCCCCAGIQYTCGWPLEILSSSFITDHLKTREADLPALEETPRPTERRQPLLFLSFCSCT